MANVYKPSKHLSQSSDEYLEAKMLFQERRRAQARLVEIDKALREVAYLYPAVVQVARNDVPFRQPHGRQKQTNQSVLANTSSALTR